jgi:hypothetical protein
MTVVSDQQKPRPPGGVSHFWPKELPALSEAAGILIAEH